MRRARGIYLSGPLALVDSLIERLLPVQQIREAEEPGPVIREMLKGLGVPEAALGPTLLYVARVADVLDKMPEFQLRQIHQPAEEQHGERLLVPKKRLEQALKEKGFSDEAIRHVMAIIEQEAEEAQGEQT